MLIRKETLLGLAVALSHFAFSAPATAQQAQLEEVVVTATRRAESVQDVALSIATVDGATLENFSISNFYEMDVPGVNIAQGGMNDNAFIRGIGQSSGNFGFENSAPYYIDGVYYGRARGTRLAWLDASSVEIVKGPVPTYLGKNASAGGIVVNSRRPTDEFSGFLDVQQEFQADELSVTGAVGGPVTDNFRVRLAGKFRDMKDGWMNNLATGAGDPQQEDTLLRLSAEWDITESLSAYAKYESVEAEWNGRNTQLENCNNPALQGDIEDCVFDDNRTAYYSPENHPNDLWDRRPPAGTTFINDFSYDGFALVLNWDLGFAELTSTTARYEFDNWYFSDVDHQVLDRGAANFSEAYEQSSQEIRLQSTGDDLDWMVGAYWDDNDNVNYARNSLAAAMGMVVMRDNDEDAESYAIFGEFSAEIADDVKLTVGGRYTDYDKENVYDQRILVGVPAGGSIQDGMVSGAATFILENSHGDSKFQPAATLEWTPDEDTLYYLSWKEGFKAGGLNHQTTSPDPDIQVVESEEVTSWELGAKWLFNDGKARVNAALFRADFDNLQTSLFDPINSAFIVGNAGAARTQGLEIDSDFLLSEHWSFSANLSFLDSQYTDYDGVACYLNPAQTAADGCLPNESGANVQDLSNTDTQFAPGFSGTFRLDYRDTLASGREVLAQLVAFNSSDYILSADGDPDLVQDGYTKLDARVSLTSADGKWSLALLGKNLTDKNVREWVGNAPLAGGSQNFVLLKRTRQFAVQARYNF